QMGFIAQEADKVIPEVVDDSGEYYTMQYAPITALLVEAVKEQNKESRTMNAELLKKIKELEEENAESKIQNTEFSAQKKHLEERLSKLESLLEGNKFSSINK
ncbi:MAG: hypothetical protein KDC90_06485, partial [Ignavibacteriae bacterium]|nr:hypothetical protein [Ignavibacteriota bacterium]